MTVTAGEAAILGLLQGLLEWLPVSSSGQLALILTQLLGLTPAAAYRLSIASHLGTALSGAIALREEVYNSLRGGPWLRIALVPLLFGAPIALAVDKLVSKAPGDLFNLAIGLLLLLTASLVAYGGRWGRGGRDAYSLKLWELALLGVLQGLAALPGLSRSAVTIAALLILGLTPHEAVKASFAMGTAATGAMALYELAQGVEASSTALLSMLTAALLAGLLSINIMIYLSRRYNRQIAVFTAIIAILAIISGLPALLG